MHALSTLQLSCSREEQRREREKWETQMRKAEELHKRELEDMQRTLTEAADERVHKGAPNTPRRS
jgi:hypothetical protein